MSDVEGPLASNQEYLIRFLKKIQIYALQPFIQYFIIPDLLLFLPWLRSLKTLFSRSSKTTTVLYVSRCKMIRCCIVFILYPNTVHFFSPARNELFYQLVLCTGIWWTLPACACWDLVSAPVFEYIWAVGLGIMSYVHILVYFNIALSNAAIRKGIKEMQRSWRLVSTGR